MAHPLFFMLFADNCMVQPSQQCTVWWLRGVAIK